jgi:hypothetical protein
MQYMIESLGMHAKDLTTRKRSKMLPFDLLRALFVVDWLL